MVEATQSVDVHSQEIGLWRRHPVVAELGRRRVDHDVEAVQHGGYEVCACGGQWPCSVDELAKTVQQASTVWI